MGSSHEQQDKKEDIKINKPNGRKKIASISDRSTGAKLISPFTDRNYQMGPKQNLVMFELSESLLK